MAKRKRTNFRKKSTARIHRGEGQRVYKTGQGFRVSPECPRTEAKNRALKRQRSKTRPAVKRRKAEGKQLVRVTVKWPDKHAPF